MSSATMQNVRALIANRDFMSAERLLNDLETPVNDELANHARRKLMQKECRIAQSDHRREDRRALVVVVTANSDLLVEARSGTKMFMADSTSVAPICLHAPHDNAGGIGECVKSTLDLTIAPHRLRKVSRPPLRQFLRSFEFAAVTDSERHGMEAHLQAAGAYRCPDAGVWVRYHPQKWGLNAFVLSDDETINERLETKRTELERVLGFPAIHDTEIRQVTSLFLYVVSATEESLLRERLRRAQQQRLDAAGGGSTADRFIVLDSGLLRFEPLINLVTLFRANPAGFALDTSSPVLADSDVLGEIRKAAGSVQVFELDDPSSAELRLAGGKAVGLHRLRNEIFRDQQETTPPGVVVSTLAFDALLKHNPTLAGAVGRYNLAEESGDRDACIATAKDVRHEFLSSEFPPVLRELLAESYARFEGKPVSVRSSAEIEDLPTVAGAAAGFGQSVLDCRSLAEVLSAIRRVFASLFSSGFVERGIKGARMACVIQEFVTDITAAGAVHSIDAATARPGYLVESGDRPGDVVDASLRPSTWLVSPDTRRVLEQRPGEGGEIPQHVLLALAKTVRRIHQHFRDRDIAPHVDVEFALSGEQIFIVQARAESSFRGNETIPTRETRSRL